MIHESHVVQENGESEAVAQRNIQELVQRLHEADMQFHLESQDIITVSETEAGIPTGRNTNPVPATQQAPRPARGVATRRSRREEQEYRPPQVGHVKPLHVSVQRM